MFKCFDFRGGSACVSGVWLPPLIDDDKQLYELYDNGKVYYEDRVALRGTPGCASPQPARTKMPLGCPVFSNYENRDNSTAHSLKVFNAYQK